MDLSTRALLVVTVVVVCWFSHTRAVIICEEQKDSICSDCLTVSKCNMAGDLPVQTELCLNGKVCDVEGGEAKCVDQAGTACECTPFTLGCDKYDPEKVTFCSIDEAVSTEGFAPNIVHTCTVTEKCSAGKCVDDTVTTRPPCTSTNSNKRYPDETDCKKYYTCREVRRGTYMYVLSTCPSPLEYDSENGYCNIDGDC